MPSGPASPIAVPTPSSTRARVLAGWRCICAIIVSALDAGESFPVLLLKWQANLTSRGHHTRRQWVLLVPRRRHHALAPRLCRANQRSRTRRTPPRIPLTPPTGGSSSPRRTPPAGARHRPERITHTAMEPIAPTSCRITEAVLQTESLTAAMPAATLRTATATRGQSGSTSRRQPRVLRPARQCVSNWSWSAATGGRRLHRDLDFPSQPQQPSVACTRGRARQRASVTVSIISSIGATSLSLGGGWLNCGVTVTNNSHDPAEDRTDRLVGHCSCVKHAVADDA